jgi:hypothetical protein
MSVTPYSHFDHAWNAGRIPLGETIRDLARSLVGPAEPDSWPEHVRAMLRPLQEAFAAHRAATEGDHGLYAEVVLEAPRLANAVDGLVAEHYQIGSAMERLAAVASEVSADADLLRREAMEVLDGLAQHRQRDSDLVYEAYATDIGGE